MHVTLIALLRITSVGIYILKSHIKVIINERKKGNRSEGNEVKHLENNRIKMDYGFSVFCFI